MDRSAKGGRQAAKVHSLGFGLFCLDTHLKSQLLGTPKEGSRGRCPPLPPSSLQLGVPLGSTSSHLSIHCKHTAEATQIVGVGQTS